MTVPLNHQSTVNPLRVALLVVAALALSSLSGCATTSPTVSHGNVGAFDGAVAAGPQLSRFFDSASEGSATSLAQSPMGSNVTVTVTSGHYFAASGFTCLRFKADHNTGAAPSSNIACLRQPASKKGSQQSPGAWVVERSVISMQQPQYINSTFDND